MLKKRKNTTDALLEDEQTSKRASWHTTRKQKKPHFTYAQRVALMFIAIVIMTAFAMIAVLGVVWDQQFQKYAYANMERLAQNESEVIARQYTLSGGWNTDVFSRVTASIGSYDDIALQILNDRGEIIYNQGRYNKSQFISSNMSDDRASTNQGQLSSPPDNSQAVIETPIVISDNHRIGTLKVWARGSEAFLTKQDVKFRHHSYGAVIVATCIALIIACLLAPLFARPLTKPVRKITNTADKIRDGDLAARTFLTGNDEIGQLGETFDDMAETLERNLKLERRLTSDVAHELRTPLMAMLATLEAMEDDVLPRDTEHLEVVADETRRLSRLVDAMLKLSRLEDSSCVCKFEKTNITQFVSSILDSQKQYFSEHELELSFSSSIAKDTFIEIDRDLITQALINLLSNALRYTPEGGKVAVEISQDMQDILISVADTGIGIEKEDLSRVFGRFWRSDASRARASGGLGIGLALTKQIVDKHDGMISVDSEVGNGTTFTIHLPKRHRNISYIHE